PAPAAPPAQSTSASAPAAPTSAPQPRTITMLQCCEPPAIAARPLYEVQSGIFTIRQIFNDTLATFDERGLPRPRLAEAVPQLNTDTWRVFPDGRMETTWKLMPN